MGGDSDRDPSGDRASPTSQGEFPALEVEFSVEELMAAIFPAVDALTIQTLLDRAIGQLPQQ